MLLFVCLFVCLFARRLSRSLLQIPTDSGFSKPLSAQMDFFVKKQVNFQPQKYIKFESLGFVFQVIFFTENRIPWDSSPSFTSIWENMFGTFSKHFEEQANPRSQWLWKDAFMLLDVAT